MHKPPQSGPEQYIPVPYKDEMIFIKTDGITSVFQPEAGTSIAWDNEKLRVGLCIDPLEPMQFSGKMVQPPANHSMFEMMKFLSQLPLEAKDMTTILAMLSAPAMTRGSVSFPEIQVHGDLGPDLQTAFEDVIYGLPVMPHLLDIQDTQNIAENAVGQAKRSIAQSLYQKGYALDASEKSYTKFVLTEGTGPVIGLNS